MREIKFRAWYQLEMYTWETNQKAILNFLSNPGIWIGTQIMQFTGLKDKNGKEIYEGDILKLYQSRGKGVSKGKVIVVWENCQFSADKISKSVIEDLESLGNYRFEDYDIEVIGNIYENPELLEAEK